MVAYALKGTVRSDMVNEPIGTAAMASRSILKDIWPKNEEIRSLMDAHVHSEMFRRRYADVYRGDERWRTIEVAGGETYGWPALSTYIQNPPYFVGMTMERDAAHGHRACAAAGDLRRLHHHRPHLARPARSSPTAQPAATCSSTASRAASSTATDRGAATTK